MTSNSPRKNRGNRLSALLQDELKKQAEQGSLPAVNVLRKPITEAFMEEGDKEFYCQDFFNEEEGDEEFEVTNNNLQEEEDVYDEDFDMEETDEHDKQVTEKDVATQEKEERKKQKKRSNVYVDPALVKKKQQKKKADGSAATPSRKRKREDAPQPTGSYLLSFFSTKFQYQKNIEKIQNFWKNTKDSSQPAEKRAKRQSTIEKTKEIQEKFDHQATPSRKDGKLETRGRKKKSTQGMTQEQRLEEAKTTTRFNTESLKRLIQIEEDTKKSVAKKFQKNHNSDEASTIFYSKNGKDYLIRREPKPKAPRSHKKKESSSLPQNKSHKKKGGFIVVPVDDDDDDEEPEKVPTVVIEESQSQPSNSRPTRKPRPLARQQIPLSNPASLMPPPEQSSQPF